MTNAADLYHEAILRAAREAPGAGRLGHPDGVAVLDNPLCGDRVRVEVRIVDGRVSEVAHEVRGCVICEAAASVIAVAAPGESLASLAAPRAALAGALDGEAVAFPAGWVALDMFVPLKEHRARHRCATLPFEALAAAVAAAG